MHERTVRRKRPLETHAMNSDQKLVAAARRRAKSLARQTSLPHQKCLDLVAIAAGRATWGHFLKDPVPVDEDSSNTAQEPDFSKLDPSDHLHEIVRHGMHLDAMGFTAFPRAWNDPTTVLDYRLRDGTAWGIDARSLDAVAVAIACGHVEHDRMRREGPDGAVMPDGWSEGGRGLLPSSSGLPMRATTILYGFSGRTRAAVSATLDGTDPVEIGYELYMAPRTEQTWTASKPSKPGTAKRIMQKIRGLVVDEDEETIVRLLRRGPLVLDHGPVVAIAKGRKLRLRHGHHLTCHSPPGTGRLTGIAAPVLLSDPVGGYVVHDDGQLHAMTSGYRSTIGRVATIRIDSATTDTINPFGAEWMRPAMDRNGYVDRISRALFPHDVVMARIVSMTAIDLIAKDGSTTIGEIRDAISTGPEREWTHRALTALRPLTTITARRLTDRSTVLPEDLNGTGTKDAPRPLTLYIVRDALSGGRRHPIAAAIQSAIWHHTLSTHPGSPMLDGRPTGPCPLAALLNDEDSLPVMPMLSQAFDLGRSKASSVILLGTTRTSIAAKYGKVEGSILDSVMGMRMVLPQSDPVQTKAIDPEGLIGPERMAALEFGDAYFMALNGTKPFRTRMPFFFEDEVMKTLACSRGLGLEPVESRR